MIVSDDSNFCAVTVDRALPDNAELTLCVFELAIHSVLLHFSSAEVEDLEVIVGSPHNHKLAKYLEGWDVPIAFAELDRLLDDTFLIRYFDGAFLNQEQIFSVESSLEAFFFDVTLTGYWLPHELHYFYLVRALDQHKLRIAVNRLDVLLRFVLQ